MHLVGTSISGSRQTNYQENLYMKSRDETLSKQKPR